MELSVYVAIAVVGRSREKAKGQTIVPPYLTATWYQVSSSTLLVYEYNTGPRTLRTDHSLHGLLAAAPWPAHTKTQGSNLFYEYIKDKDKDKDKYKDKYKNGWENEQAGDL